MRYNIPYSIKSNQIWSNDNVRKPLLHTIITPWHHSNALNVKYAKDEKQYERHLTIQALVVMIVSLHQKRKQKKKDNDLDDEIKHEWDTTGKIQRQRNYTKNL